MTRKKRILTCILSSLIIASCFATPALAAEPTKQANNDASIYCTQSTVPTDNKNILNHKSNEASTQKLNSSDETTSSQQDLASEILESLEKENFPNQEDEIKYTLEKILDAKSKTEYVISNYDFSQLLNFESDYSNLKNLEFFKGYIKFQHDFRDALNLKIENLTTVYTYDKTDITDDTAKIKVKQKLNFHSTGSSIDTSETNTFEFQMKKENNIWKIKEFSSDDLYFQMYYPKMLERSNFNFEQLTQDYITPQEDPELNNLSNNDSEQAFAASTRCVDELDVYTYALEYANTYNSDFPSFPGVDCQNFASQCLWFGLGAEIPPGSIDTAPFDNSGNYKWYCKKGSGTTNSWTSCSNFRNYLKNNTKANERGLIGTVYDKMTSSVLLKARCGDIVYTNAGGHAMSITSAPFPQFEKNDPRTIYTLYVSAHSQDVHNKQLALICGNNLSSCMFAHIDHFKY